MNIFYINLDKSVERKNYMEQQASKKGLDINRISGIYGLDLLNQKYREKVSNILNINERYLQTNWLLSRSNFKTMSCDINYILPRFGLYLSTIKLLQQAKASGFNNCVVLEDDSIILDEIVVPNIENADIIYLGATFQGERYSNEKIIKVHPDKIKLYGTFAYYVNDIDSMLKVLLAPFQDGKAYDKNPGWRSGTIKLRCQNIDSFLKNYYQKYGDCYFLNPAIVEHPVENISTINKKQYNYGKNNLRFKY